MNQLSVNRIFLLLSILLVVVMYPRFDRVDRFGIDAFTTGGERAAVHKADSEHYENNVLYFRGDADQQALRTPWAFRLLPTYAASLLPFDALTSINVINFLSLMLGLFCLLKLLELLGFSSRVSACGGVLYTVSFPVFYYGGIGYIEPVLVGMVTMSTYFIFSGKERLFLLSLILGAFVKETYVVILPVWATYQLVVVRRDFWRTVGLGFVLTLIFLLTVVLIRFVVPVSADYIWVPKSELIEFNFLRLRSWFSFGLTFGLAGVLAMVYLIRSRIAQLRDPNTLVLLAGFVASLLIASYAMLSAYADGRYFWIAYPFMIPIACMQLDRLFKQ